MIVDINITALSGEESRVEISTDSLKDPSGNPVVAWAEDFETAKEYLRYKLHDLGFLFVEFRTKGVEPLFTNTMADPSTVVSSVSAAAAPKVKAASARGGKR
jgi:hypothetical protein